MKILEGDLAKDERGVEPTVMKILAGVILVSIGLGIGVTMYQRFGGQAQDYLNYSVTVDPGAGDISLGSSDSATVSINSPTGFDGDVTLKADLPENVEVLFNNQEPPYTEKVPYDVEMSIIVGPDANPGPYALNIRGTSGDTTKQDSYELTITE